jgi:hypothetical protein
VSAGPSRSSDGNGGGTDGVSDGAAGGSWASALTDVATPAPLGRTALRAGSCSAAQPPSDLARDTARAASGANAGNSPLARRRSSASATAAASERDMPLGSAAPACFPAAGGAAGATARSRASVAATDDGGAWAPHCAAAPPGGAAALSGRAATVSGCSSAPSDGTSAAGASSAPAAYPRARRTMVATRSSWAPASSLTNAATSAWDATTWPQRSSARARPRGVGGR